MADHEASFPRLMARAYTPPRLDGARLAWHRRPMSFDPAALLSTRATRSDEGAIVRMSQMTRDLRARGRDVVSLTLGEPDFDTPDHIQKAAAAAMKAGHTHYSPVAGIPDLRAALARKLREENGLNYPAS